MLYKNRLFLNLKQPVFFSHYTFNNLKYSVKQGRKRALSYFIRNNGEWFPKSGIVLIHNLSHSSNVSIRW